MFDGKTNPRARINAIAARFLACARFVHNAARYPRSRHPTLLTISRLFFCSTERRRYFRIGEKQERLRVAFTVMAGNNSRQSDVQLRRPIRKKDHSGEIFFSLFPLFYFLEILASLSLASLFVSAFAEPRAFFAEDAFSIVFAKAIFYRFACR